MSWSRAAYSSSSRSSGPRRCRPRGARRVEQLEGEPGDLARVRLVERGGARELQHAPLAHAGAVLELVLAGAGEVVEQQALAQAALVERDDRLDAEVLHERLEDRGAGDDDVRPRRREPRHGAPLVGGHPAEALRHRAQVLARERLVAARHAVVQSPRRHRGEVHDRARGAVGGRLRPADVPQRVLRREAHVVLEGLVGRARTGRRRRAADPPSPGGWRRARSTRRASAPAPSPTATSVLPPPMSMTSARPSTCTRLSRPR